MTGLDVRLIRRVHPGLTLNVDFFVGVESAILFGESGAGKSTILRLIGGLEQADEGSVTLNGFVLSNPRERIRVPLRNRQIGMIFQDDLLFPHLSVAQNVRFGLTDRISADARLREVARLCGIGHLLDRRPSTLSGGERQRVGLARAIAPRPRLLLCDEPFSALDLDARHALIDRLKAIQRAEGIPVLTVTHAVDEAIALGDRLMLLEGGRIVDQGEPMDVLARSGSKGWPSIRNSFRARVIAKNHSETSLELEDGPTLVVPSLDSPSGTAVTVTIRADDIVLARGPIGAISARNVIPGTVYRVVRHGHEAEVIIKTGGIQWIVGLVSGAVESLGLVEGSDVLMIVKARGCRILRDRIPCAEEALDS